MNIITINLKDKIGTHLYYRSDVWDLFVNDPNLNDVYVLDYSSIEYTSESYNHELNKYRQIYQIKVINE